MNQNMASWRLTINFLFYWGIGMEDTECMDKFVELNNTISLFIKKIKNLQEEKPEEFSKYITNSNIPETAWLTKLWIKASFSLSDNKDNDPASTYR